MNVYQVLPGRLCPRDRALGGFTLIELLTVIAIIAVLAAILFPVFARAREKGRQAACLSNLRQIGLAVIEYEQDYDDLLPGCPYLKQTLGYRNWLPATAWPPSDPRTGWAAIVLNPYIKSGGIWTCPSVDGTPVANAPMVKQVVGNITTGYWMWRFDHYIAPLPLSDCWAKTDLKCVSDVDKANDTTENPEYPQGPDQLELAVDPYFPSTKPTVLPLLKGYTPHTGGRDRLMLDGHLYFLPDARTGA